MSSKYSEGAPFEDTKLRHTSGKKLQNPNYPVAFLCPCKFNYSCRKAFTLLHCRVVLKLLKLHCKSFTVTM